MPRLAVLARMLLAWLVVTLAGCSEAPKPEPSDTQALAETAEGDGWLWDTDTEGAGQSDVVLPDLGQLDSALACPGAAGCDCAADSDCVLGLCVETASGRVCASLCSSECPPGFLCRSAPLGGDPVSYCAPAGVRQCAPCNTQADCNSQWSVPAVCVAAGAAGSFCAQTCNLQSDCASGLACVAVPGQGKVCQPQAGMAACTCSAWASAQGASTACFVVEGTKACPGVRSCGAAGLLACAKLDGEACADATCTGAANGQPCDDGDPCTQSECQAGVCTVTDNNLCQCQSTADCPDDANLCNGKAFCDKSSPPWQCKTNPASVVNCPQPADPCQVAVCLPESGSCTTAETPSGQPCDDGDPCTQSECQAGVCTVTDNNLCQCQSTADCPDDANLCNGKPFCDKSSPPWQCKTNPASVVNCPQPTDPCKLAVCDPATGSCSTANAPDNTPCSDGAACTVGDVCVAGSCVPGTVTCACTSDADCAGYEDGNQCNGTLFCNKVTGQCQVNPKTVVYCPTGLDSACQQTVCVPKTGACELALAPTTTLCDDGNPCSASDHCMDGSCVSTTNICVCQSDADCASSDDGNLCNGTLYCELSSGTCQINPKTVVLCPITASNPCAPIVCQPSTGECQPSPLLAGSCDDGDPCTAPGSCVQGACVAGPPICQCKSQADCAVFDDANPCNGTFFCDTSVGQCKSNLAAVPVCPPSGEVCQVNTCVDSMAGATELDKVDGAIRGFTYVTLSRLAPWSKNAPEKVVARMLGGPGSKTGRPSTAQAALVVGEQVGYFGFYMPDNNGYPGIDSQWLFKNDGKGGVTNEELFTLVPWTVTELGEVVWWNMQAGGGCPLDAVPNNKEDL